MMLRKSCRLLSLSLLLLCLFMTSAERAHADLLPTPRKRPETPKVVHRMESNVVIKYVAKEELGENVQAKILIPLNKLPRQFGAMDQIDEVRDIAASAPRSEVPAPAHGTILAGVALSCGAISLIFLLRGTSWKKTSLSIVMCAAGVLGAWGFVQADVARPGKAPGKPAPAAHDLIRIETLDRGDTVTLILPNPA